MKRLLCIISIAVIGLLSTAAYAAPPPATIKLEPPHATLERIIEWQTVAVAPSQTPQIVAVDYTSSDFLLQALIAVAFAVGMGVMHQQARPRLERQRAQMRAWLPREHPPYLTSTN
ncbi:MAG: hypothetical protein HC933_00580 [Pleurocapsa sp. SU_196_0]|nr:hypothetical protein [Pleurocapsa sp. SU_196_0]